MNLNSLHPKKDIRKILIRTFNYGDIEHLKWIFSNYSLREIKKVLSKILKSEFVSPKTIKFLEEILNLNLEYASRQDYIREQKVLQKLGEKAYKK